MDLTRGGLAGGLAEEALSLVYIDVDGGEHAFTAVARGHLVASPMEEVRSDDPAVRIVCAGESIDGDDPLFPRLTSLAREGEPCKYYILISISLEIAVLRVPDARLFRCAGKAAPGSVDDCEEWSLARAGLMAADQVDVDIFSLAHHVDRVFVSDFLLSRWKTLFPDGGTPMERGRVAIARGVDPEVSGGEIHFPIQWTPPDREGRERRGMLFALAL